MSGSDKESQDGDQKSKRKVRTTLERLKAEREEVKARRKQAEAQLLEKQREIEKSIKFTEREQARQQRIKQDQATRELQSALGRKVLEMMLSQDPKNLIIYFDDFNDLPPAVRRHLDEVMRPWLEDLESLQGII
jgi:septal ring factor EnvC (AmiA/AmiB activator)